MSAAAKSPALAVVVALWVNLAVLPCAMAFGAEDADCVRCPTAQEDDAAMSHDGHGRHGHHDAATPVHCASAAATCGDAGEFGIDSRGSQNNPKVKADVVATLAAWPQEAFEFGVGCSTSAADPPDRVSPPLSLHILNCVFLD